MARIVLVANAMPHSLIDGLSLVDPTGRIILATTLLCLLTAIATNLIARSRYAELRRDLEHGAAGRFAHPLLQHLVDDAMEAARHSSAPNTQALIEDRLQLELKPLLVAERFVKSATGLVIILGLLGTFYGLTLSIGRIVALVSSDTAGVDVANAVGTGLTHALSGMAVAFSNSLVGIGSAVLLTVLGVFSNPSDQRTALMLQLETHLDRLLAGAGANPAAAGVVEAVARLENVVARFESGLKKFTESAGDFHQFNAHLKDNIQRMSLSFSDFSDTLKGQVGALKARDGR